MKPKRLMQLAASAVVSVLLTNHAAVAEYRRRVIVLEREGGEDSDREVTTRVRAELTAAGFEVVVMPVAGSDPKQAVEDAGHELHPASVLLVERLPESATDKETPGGAELWLADRLLHKTVVLRLKPDESGTARVAVQAVELVKARLAELAVTRERAAPAAPTAAAPPPPPPAPSRRAHPSLTLGLGLLQGMQKGQQSLTPVVRLGVGLPGRVTGEVMALDVRSGFLGLGRTARVELGERAATIRHTAATLDVVARFLPDHGVQPFVTLGGGLLSIDVAGDAPEPYRNASARTFSGLLAASGGVWLEPVHGFGLALEGQVLDAWSKTIVRISGQNAAEIAAPLLLLSAGLVAEF